MKTHAARGVHDARRAQRRTHAAQDMQDARHTGCETCHALTAIRLAQYDFPNTAPMICRPCYGLGAAQRYSLVAMAQYSLDGLHEAAQAACRADAASPRPPRLDPHGRRRTPTAAIWLVRALARIVPCPLGLSREPFPNPFALSHEPPLFPDGVVHFSAFLPTYGREHEK